MIVSDVSFVEAESVQSPVGKITIMLSFTQNPIAILTDLVNKVIILKHEHKLRCAKQVQFFFGGGGHRYYKIIRFLKKKFKLFHI